MTTEERKAAAGSFGLSLEIEHFPLLLNRVVKMFRLASFPMLLLALVVASVLGGGIQNVIIALSVATIS